MKAFCPECKNSLTGPKSAMGTRVDCPECRHSFYWTDRQHAGETFVVYDLETTGLDPEQDEFIQVAAMRFTAGCLCPDETFASFAKPRRRISPFIESYTGVGNQHVAMWKSSAARLLACDNDSRSTAPSTACRGMGRFCQQIIDYK